MDIFSLKLLLIPIYITNHWLLVTVEGLDSDVIEMHLYDAKYVHKYKYILKEIETFIKMEYLLKKKQNLPAVICSTSVGDIIPRQTNDNDCGVFLCQFGKCVALSLSMDFEETDRDALRKGMIQELKRTVICKKLLKY